MKYLLLALLLGSCAHKPNEKEMREFCFEATKYDHWQIENSMNLVYGDFEQFNRNTEILSAEVEGCITGLQKWTE